MNNTLAHDFSGYNLVVLLGIPRSGTSLIMRHLSAHSNVFGIMEPFQSNREMNYRCENFIDLLTDYDFTKSPETSIILKETTTRIDNIKLSIDLLNNARKLNVHCGLILILRSPLECYLSQVHASRNIWKEKKMTNVDSKQFKKFCYDSLLGIAEIVKKVSFYSYRLTTYNYFIDNYITEVSRLLALFPVRAENISHEKFTRLKGGDPFARNTLSVCKQNTRDISILMPFIEKGDEIERAAFEIHKVSQICSLSQLNSSIIDSIIVILSKAGFFSGHRLSAS